MGPFASTVLYGCLEALKWLLWATAGLLVVLIVTQALRGDADARPLVNLAMAGAFLVGGALCRGAAALGRRMAES